MTAQGENVAAENAEKPDALEVGADLDVDLDDRGDAHPVFNNRMRVENGPSTGSPSSIPVL